jgi:lipopolysaccharide/colanic/teichoic acid biosynthesis glycosyltransferase
VSLIAKRVFDLTLASLGILLMAPLLALICCLIWMEDRHSPFYVGQRVGKGGRIFGMVKLRSMTPRADATGVDSTQVDDPRITRVGRYIRVLKLDEFSQLINVVAGDMSLVGPRPQVPRDVALYTDEERGLLTGVPGITDFSSVVFADEGEILRGADDPDLRYHQLIRPWKSRLGLHYLAVRTLWIDLRLIIATLVSAVSPRRALAVVGAILRATEADSFLVEVSQRTASLSPFPPPGTTEVVSARDLQLRNRP